MLLLLVYLKLIIVLFDLILRNSNISFQFINFLNESLFLSSHFFDLLGCGFSIFLRVIHHFIESLFVLLQKFLSFIKLLLLHCYVLSKPLILFIFGIDRNLRHKNLTAKTYKVSHSFLAFCTFFEVFYSFWFVHQRVQLGHSWACLRNRRLVVVILTTWDQGSCVVNVTKTGKILFLKHGWILLLKNINFLVLIGSSFVILVISLHKLTSSTLPVSTFWSFNTLDLSNDTLSRWSWLFFFLMNPKAFFLEPMKLLELTFPLSDHQQFFSFLLDSEWVFLVLLKIDILVLSQTKSWKHARVTCGWIHHRVASLTSVHPTRFTKTSWCSCKAMTCWLIVSFTRAWNWFIASWTVVAVLSILICPISWVGSVTHVVSCFWRSRDTWDWSKTSRFLTLRRWKISAHWSLAVRHWAFTHKVVPFDALHILFKNLNINYILFSIQYRLFINLNFSD